MKLKGYDSHPVWDSLGLTKHDAAIPSMSYLSLIDTIGLLRAC